MVDGGLAYRVKEILAERRMGRGRQFLVEWEGYGPEDRSWVPGSFILDPGLITTFRSTLPGPSKTPPGGGVLGGEAPVAIAAAAADGSAPSYTAARMSAAAAGGSAPSYADVVKGDRRQLRSPPGGVSARPISYRHHSLPPDKKTPRPGGV